MEAQCAEMQRRNWNYNSLGMEAQCAEMQRQNWNRRHKMAKKKVEKCLFAVMAAALSVIGLWGGGRENGRGTGFL